MSDRLTPLDATFLELEQADESAHMHIGAILVFHPLPAGGAPSREQLCELLDGRLRQLPRYRQRLSPPHTGGLSWPEWTPDPSFDIANHLSRAALPAPGGERELCEWASGFFSQRLDRRRPLWEMVVVEGLQRDRWALATKTHHCMVDGVGSVDVGHLMLDPTPDHRGASPNGIGARPPARRSAPATTAEGGPLARLAHAWGGLLPTEAMLHVARAGAQGLVHPRQALRHVRSALAMILDEELHPAPHTSLNEPIGTRRRFEVVRVPLAELKRIKGSLGGTINDVALAATSSALRALLLARGEALPQQGLRAMVPMNVRLAGERLALGNRISSLFLELPVAQPDAVVRYGETVARSRSLKADGKQAAGTTAVIELTGLAPPVIHAALAQALYATRLFNLTVTNVPGPRQTLYAFGAPLREVHPLVPLAAEHALGVAITSYDGNVFFGVVADPDAVPDLDVYVEALRSSLAELLALAHPNEATPAGRARAKNAKSPTTRASRSRSARAA
jgi:diacylglycerol O-acyltransferase